MAQTEENQILTGKVLDQEVDDQGQQAKIV
jgi:hypothetical protein